MNDKPKTREDLLELIASYPGAQASSDQVMAAVKESARVASENQGKGGDPDIEKVIRLTLHVVDDKGPARAAVVRLSEVRPDHAREFDRPAHDYALPQTAIAARCGICNESTSRTVPFWYPCGQVIVQVDLCLDCATRKILEGHKQRPRGPVPEWA